MRSRTIPKLTFYYTCCCCCYCCKPGTFGQIGNEEQPSFFISHMNYVSSHIQYPKNVGGKGGERLVYTEGFFSF